MLFGDVFSPDWLFDAVVNRDAVRLGAVNMRGGIRGYAPLNADGRATNQDLILAHGEACRAVLLADDCEIETCLVRKGGRGRLLFAALTPWPDDEAEAEKARTTRGFRRHPLEPDEPFAGGIVELNRLFAVKGAALANLGTGVPHERSSSSAGLRLRRDAGRSPHWTTPPSWPASSTPATTYSVWGTWWPGRPFRRTRRLRWPSRSRRR